MLAELANAQSSDRIILEHADSLVGYNSAQPYRNYMGNVSFRQGNAYVNADLARHFIGENRVILTGNVKIRQNKLTLYSPLMVYNGNTKIADSDKSIKIIENDTKLTADSGMYFMEARVAEFNGNVIVENDSSIIFSDYIQHRRTDEYSLAEGNAAIFGKYSSSFLSAGKIENFPEKSYSIATLSPKLFRLDSLFEAEYFAGFDTLSVSADTMESFRGENEYYLFHGSVIIARGEVSASADSALFNQKAGLLKLYKSPIVWFSENQLTADSIHIYYSESKLDSINAFANALSLSRSEDDYSERVNQLSGDTIKIVVHDSKLDIIISIGNSESLYNLYTDAGIPDGLIKHSAHSIVVDFEQDELRDINWLEQVKGKMFPESSVAANPSDYYLARFKDFFPKPQVLSFPSEQYKKFILQKTKK